MHKAQPKAKYIASLLIQVLHIPEDGSLVPVFGCGHESSNHEAITFWVETKIDEIDAEEVIFRLEQMANDHSRTDPTGGVKNDG
ncbi:MAG: hypothetical protein D6694_04075 [Gammaproteobacteria bacterium]|nr:MAG: hypothetical protein D6694_04075 [Gammaproteobacteria bacterium]